MLKNTRKFRCVFLCVLLSVSFLCSCARSSPSQPGDYESYRASESGGAQLSESPAPDSPQVQKARVDFDTLCGKLFHDQLSENYLTLHYTLADPASYGITDCALDFGDFSLELLKEAGETQKEDKAALDKIPVQFLTKQQQLTYKILQATYEAEAKFEGLELYYQPLAPTVGVQAQLPVLLAEYIFYSRQDVEDYLTLLSTIDR